MSPTTSVRAGQALLRVMGVRGDNSALERAVRDFGGSALALTLLAGFLREVPGHDVAEAANMPNPDLGAEKTKSSNRVFAAYEARHGDAMLHPFNCYVSSGCSIAAETEWIATVAAGGIPGLVDGLPQITSIEWRQLLKDLRRDAMIAPENRHQPEVVEAHPVVRDYFAERFRSWLLTPKLKYGLQR